MVEILRKEAEISEGPQQINEDNVMYWSKHTKELQGSQVRKALLFLRHDCIKYIGQDEEFGSKYCFVVLPLNTKEEWIVDGRVFQKRSFTKDYNSSDYKIYKNEDGDFECNCQAWQTKYKRDEIVPSGANCSHILSLYYAFKIKRFRK